MREAGGTAGSLKEVAAKVHCVARAMMAGVPKAPGVKVLGISFIRKEGKRFFRGSFGAKSLEENPRLCFYLCWCRVVVCTSP